MATNSSWAIRYLLIVLTYFAAAGCSDVETHKSTNPEAILKCMRAHPGSDDYVLETTCSPLGQSETFNGTWFVGFEQSLFRAGYKVVPAQTGQDPKNLQELVVQTSLRAKVAGKSHFTPSAYQLSFVGRVSSLSGPADRKIIVLDRLLALHPVTRETSEIAVPAH